MTQITIKDTKKPGWMPRRYLACLERDGFMALADFDDMPKPDLIVRWLESLEPAYRRHCNYNG
jgi:hypothetical protein